MKPITIFILSLILLDGCIDPFTANIPDGQESIVVNGMITDQPGPYTIEISRSSALNNPYDNVAWVTGARVVLSDDVDMSEVLVEQTPGHYSSSTIQGIVGRSYSIAITMKEGADYAEYISTTEKLLPVGDFSNLHYSFDQKLTPDDPIHPLNGFNIYLDADLTPEQNGLVRWRWTGTYEIITHPETRTKLAPGPIISYVPDPYPCSGYIVPFRSPVIVYQRPCTCCTCWVTQYNQTPLLSNPRLANNNKITQYNVAYVPATPRFFTEKYYLEVEQMSTSQVVYDFWNKVATQGNQGSDLFQTPPPATEGNIQLVSGHGVAAIGVFAAASIRKHSFIIFPTDIPYTLQSQDTVALDCRQVYPNSVTTKPTFW